MCILSISEALFYYKLQNMKQHETLLKQFLKQAASTVLINPTTDLNTLTAQVEIHSSALGRKLICWFIYLIHLLFSFFFKFSFF